MVEYDILDDYLAQSDADVGAAELHGSFTGAVCAQGALDEKQWHELVFSNKPGEGAEMKPELHSLLKELYEKVITGLNDSNLEFEVLLPDEDEALDFQVNGLGSWCRGFLFGLTLGGVRDIDSLPDEVGEVIQDFLAISQVSAEGLESEDVESQLMEIMEYLRVSSLLVHEELQPFRQIPASMRDSEQLH